MRRASAKKGTSYSAAERKAYGAGIRAAAKSRPSTSAYRSRVKGRGDYKVMPSKSTTRAASKGWAVPAGAAIGSGIGTAIAPGIGTAIGTGLGMLAGGLMSKITGMGDYQVHVKQNTLLQRASIPDFGPSAIRVRHKEYLGDISSATSFTNLAFDINPGQSTVFPWLSAIAQNYQQWRPNGMVFFFDSTSADALNSTNTALGKVVMATNYDSGAENFVNVQQMLGTDLANYGKPSDCIMHAIECDPGETQMRLFTVRTGDVPDGQDPKTFDLGKFQIATQGSQASANVGGLWVIYDITFVKPIMNNALALGIGTDHYAISAGNQSGGNYFGPGAVKTPNTGSSLGTTVTTDTILFPPLQQAGYFLVQYSMTGGSVTLAQPNLNLTNCTLVGNFWYGNTQNRFNNGGAAGTRYMEWYVVSITGQNSAVAYSGGTLPTTGGGGNVGDLVITQINADVN